MIRRDTLRGIVAIMLALLTITSVLLVIYRPSPLLVALSYGLWTGAFLVTAILNLGR